MLEWQLLLDDYRQYLERKGLSSSSIRAYLCDASQFVSELERRGCEKDDLDLSAASRAFDSILSSPLSIGSSQWYAPSTIRRKVAGVNSLLRYLADDGAIPRIALVRKRPVESKANRQLQRISKDELLNILERPDAKTFLGARDTAIMSLVILCGMRSQEISGLNTESVSLDAATVHIGESTTAWMPPYALARMDRWLNLRTMFARSNPAVFVSVGKGEAPSKDAARLSARSVRKACANYVRKVIGENRGVTINDVRASAAILLLGDDAVEKEIRQQFSVARRTLHAYRRLTERSSNEIGRVA